MTENQPITHEQIAEAARRAAILLREPDRWIKWAYGQAVSGKELGLDQVHQKQCVKFCVVGAFVRELSAITGDKPHERPADSLQDMARDTYDRHAEYVNNNWGLGTALVLLDTLAANPADA